MKRLWCIVTACLAATCSIGVSGEAGAGASVVTTVQDGSWTNSSVWDLRVPDASLGDQAQVNHVLSIGGFGLNADVLNLGTAGGAGTLNFIFGELTVESQLTLGAGGTGTIEIPQATGLTVHGSGIVIGGTSPGILNFRTGDIELFGDSVHLDIGTGAGTGHLKLQSSFASFNIISSLVGPALNIGNNGTITIQPEVTISAGTVMTIVVIGTASLSGGSTLILDTSTYTPTVGEKWEPILASGGIAGTFGMLAAPAGYTITQSVVDKGGGTQALEIEVTSAPLPEVWVDFGFSGVEDGTQSNPYDTLAEALERVTAGGTIKFKGDVATTASSETAAVNQDVTLRAVNGAVSIGAPALRSTSGSQSGFLSRSSANENH